MHAEVLAALVAALSTDSLSWTMPTQYALRDGACAADPLNPLTSAPVRWEVAGSWQSPSWAYYGPVWGLANWPVVRGEAERVVLAEGYAAPGARVTIAAPIVVRSPKTYWVRTWNSRGPSCWSNPVTRP